MDLEDQVQDLIIKLPRFTGYHPKPSSANESSVSWAGSSEFYLTREHLDDGEGKGKGKGRAGKDVVKDEENAQLTEADQKECKAALEALMFEFDLQDERPWRADRLMDFFNYDLNERTFRDFIKRQIKLRFEKRSLTKLGANPGSTTTGGYLGQGRRNQGGPYGGGYGNNNMGNNNMGGNMGGMGGGGGHMGGGYGQQGGGAMGGKGFGNDNAGQGNWNKGGGSKDHQSGDASANLYIVGFPKAWGQPELREYFATYGPVNEVAVLPLRDPSHRAAGIVKMDTIQTATRAIAATNNQPIPGFPGNLEVRYKLPPKKQAGGKKW